MSVTNSSPKPELSVNLILVVLIGILILVFSFLLYRIAFMRSSAVPVTVSTDDLPPENPNRVITPITSGQSLTFKRQGPTSPDITLTASEQLVLINDSNSPLVLSGLSEDVSISAGGQSVIGPLSPGTYQIQDRFVERQRFNLIVK
jgi:hypothetical protein